MLSPPHVLSTPTTSGELRWDGYDLGRISPLQINLFTINTTNCVELTLGLQRVSGEIVQVDNALPCIVDNMKSIFGLRPRGCYRFSIGDTKYIVYRMTEHEQVLGCIDTRELAEDPGIREQVQRTLLYRDIMMMSYSGEKSLHIGYENGAPIIISCRETKITNKVMANTPILIPPSLYMKWFDGGISENELVASMVGYNGDITTTLSELNTVVQMLINSIDRDYVWISGHIMERVSRRLMALGGHI